MIFMLQVELNSQNLKMEKFYVKSTNMMGVCLQDLKQTKIKVQSSDHYNNNFLNYVTLIANTHKRALGK